MQLLRLQCTHFILWTEFCTLAHSACPSALLLLPVAQTPVGFICNECVVSCSQLG